MEQEPLIMNIIMIGGMFAVFYFVVLRPQKKADRQKEYMQNNLKKGDKVITVSGVYGVVSALYENRVAIRVAEKVDVEVARTAIARFQDDTKQELMKAAADGK